MKNLRGYALLSLFFFIAFLHAGPIASGFWVKIKIPSEGVYKIGYNELSNAGFDLASTDPRKIQLRGHQCGMLPESNGLHEGGMPEIAIVVQGEDDGKFDAADYILFYAGAKDKWIFDANENNFQHEKNLYSDEGFLYLGVGSTNGLRVQALAEITAPTQKVVTRHVYTAFHDSDLFNPLSMSRLWIGEKMGNETLKRNFLFNLPLNSDDSAFVRLSFAGGMHEGGGSLKTVLNGDAQSKSFGPLNEEQEAYQLSSRKQWVPVPSHQLSLELELTRPNTQSAAWFDYIEINALRDNDASQSPIVLRNQAYHSNGVCETRLAGTGNQVWNVSDEMHPGAMTVKNGSGYEYFKSDKAGISGAFVAFQISNCYHPVFVGSVTNADILAGDPTEFIIISHPDFLNAANDLASYRRVHDGYSVKVVTPQAIYNEYNASQQDIVAIRDYLRDEYNKSIKAGTKLQFVLLMGSTSFDPKSRITKNTNFVPIYQRDSPYKSLTYCLDDFYAYLDSTGGDPEKSRNYMWFSVGRIPARTSEEASNVVAKLKRYAAKEALGPWRTELSFVCDDVDDPDFEKEFLTESEKYANVINNVHPDLLVNKIYTDAYKQQSTGNTEQYPEVSTAIDRYMNNGTLFMNYQGHGGEKGWAQEAILTVPMINAWKNANFMPVLFTATCEFGRYDDPGLQSGGELALLNPNGGAIALMTTTRLVFVNGNSAINNDFWTNYGFPKPNEPVPTIGDLYLKMKNRPTPTSEDKKFALLGDPSMRLAFPEHQVLLDSINGKESATFTDTLKAFSVVRMKGHIEKRLGGKFSNFQGNLWVKVFDKPQTRYTLDNDNNGAALPFKDQTSFIYKGVVSVTNGDFSIVFSVPKDIAYNVDLGKILMYAHNGETDASGAMKLLIGSSVDDVTPDDEGPKVKLFMNDTTFIYGGNVLPNALFIAKVYDENGINATGAGIGRDMIAVLDPGTAGEQMFILNDYFSYDLNSYTRGTVNYDLKDLAEGRHLIRFKVWDIHNNSAEAELSFVVLGEDVFVVNNNYTKPNPFHSEVSFAFTHNMAGKNIKATLSVFDLQGRMLIQFDQQLDNASYNEDRLVWNGKTAGFSEVNQGLYLYRVDLVSEDGRKTSFNGKLMRN